MIVQPNFLDHWKTNALSAKIGRLEAITALLALWSHCQQQRTWQFPDSEIMIAGICRYTGNPRVLLDTLVELKLLEKVGENTLEVHEWAETNAKLLHNWAAGKKGGRPSKQPKDKPTDNPRDNPGQTQGITQGKPIREDKIREEKIPPNPPGGTKPDETGPNASPSSETIPGEGLSEKKKKAGAAAEAVARDVPSAVALLGPLLTAYGRDPRQALTSQEEHDLLFLLRSEAGLAAADVARVAAAVTVRRGASFAALPDGSPLRRVKLSLASCLQDWPAQCALAREAAGGATAAAKKKKGGGEPEWDWRAVCWAVYGGEPLPWREQVHRDRQLYAALWGQADEVTRARWAARWAAREWREDEVPLLRKEVAA